MDLPKHWDEHGDRHQIGDSLLEELSDLQNIGEEMLERIIIKLQLKYLKAKLNRLESKIHKNKLKQEK